MPHRRFLISAALCCAFFLGHQSNAAASTATTLCGQKTAANYRSLSSAQTVVRTQVRSLCVKMHKSRTVLKFFAHHRVAVAPRYRKCWMVPDKKWRHQVCKNRAIVRQYRVKLTRSQRRLEVLAVDMLPLGNIGNWDCIHDHEGSWTANTGNGYYGGLQMNLKFQQVFGPEFLAQYGTADNWPWKIQVAVAQRALKKLGSYSPWPNTAHDCGLY